MCLSFVCQKEEKKCQKMLQLQWLNFNIGFLYTFRRNIHPETVRRRLCNTEMLAQRPHKSIPLSPRQKFERLRWAKAPFAIYPESVGQSAIL